MKTKIYIDDVIGAFSFFDDDGLTEKSIRDQLAAADGDIEIHINSPGGEVFQGHGIYNAIKDYSKGTVSVIIGGVAASIASVIAYAGDALPMVRINSSIMIHNPKTIAMGDSREMQKTAQALDTVKSSIIAVYEDAMPDSSSDFSELMNDQTFFTASQAIEAGMAIAYEDTEHEVSNDFDLEIDNKMSFEEIVRAFVKAKRDFKNSTNMIVTINGGLHTSESVRDLIEAVNKEIEVSASDDNADRNNEDKTKFTNEAARLRYVQILTEDAEAGIASGI